MISIKTDESEVLVIKKKKKTHRNFFQLTLDVQNSQVNLSLNFCLQVSDRNPRVIISGSWIENRSEVN